MWLTEDRRTGAANFCLQAGLADERAPVWVLAGQPDATHTGMGFPLTRWTRFHDQPDRTSDPREETSRGVQAQPWRVRTRMVDCSPPPE
jgi:hypothetical protein